jgi:hypothetical protein
LSGHFPQRSRKRPVNTFSPKPYLSIFGADPGKHSGQQHPLQWLPSSP